MRCIEEAYFCLTCAWKGPSGKLISLDKMRCPSCRSSDIRWCVLWEGPTPRKSEALRGPTPKRKTCRPPDRYAARRQQGLSRIATHSPFTSHDGLCPHSDSRVNRPGLDRIASRIAWKSV
jgi:hypothetical protein